MIAAGNLPMPQSPVMALDQKPATLPGVTCNAEERPMVLPAPTPTVTAVKDLVGIEVFMHASTPVEELAEKMKAAETGVLEPAMITNRGVKVWPGGGCQ